MLQSTDSSTEHIHSLGRGAPDSKATIISIAYLEDATVLVCCTLDGDLKTCEQIQHSRHLSEHSCGPPGAQLLLRGLHNAVSRLRIQLQLSEQFQRRIIHCSCRACSQQHVVAPGFGNLALAEDMAVIHCKLTNVFNARQK